MKSSLSIQPSLDTLPSLASCRQQLEHPVDRGQHLARSLSPVVEDGLDVVAIGVEDERAVVALVVDGSLARRAVVSVTASSAARWKASTSSRLFAAKAT
jgi:hypothetical protein